MSDWRDDIQDGIRAFWNRSYNDDGGDVMPLLKSKSDAAVGKNIETETAAGKPRKQAIAIALETQRRAKGKRKAKGK